MVAWCIQDRPQWRIDSSVSVCISVASTVAVIVIVWVPCVILSRMSTNQKHVVKNGYNVWHHIIVVHFSVFLGLNNDTIVLFTIRCFVFNLFGYSKVQLSEFILPQLFPITGSLLQCRTTITIHLDLLVPHQVSHVVDTEKQLLTWFLDSWQILSLSAEVASLTQSRSACSWSEGRGTEGNKFCENLCTAAATLSGVATSLAYMVINASITLTWAFCTYPYRQ